MLFLQSAVSFSGNALTVLVIILLVRDAWRFPAARIAVFLFAGTIAYSLTLLPGPLALPPQAYKLALLANAPTLGLNWLLGRALLQDGFRMRAAEWGVLAGTTALMLADIAPAFGVSPPARALIGQASFFASLAVIGHISWIALSGFRDDLVDVRRVIRIWFVIFVLLSYAVLIVIDLLNLPNSVLAIGFDATTIAINLSIILWAASLETARLFPPRPEEAGPGHAVPPHMAPAYGKLLAVMEQDRAYRDYGLSISELARRVGLPEYQLRALINGALGYRNFSAFLNSYRLAEARQALSDPDEARTPVLTIAMDAGYQTLSTFNRAFKASEGVTPSAYRRRALGADGTVPSR